MKLFRLFRIGRPSGDEAVSLVTKFVTELEKELAEIRARLDHNSGKIDACRVRQDREIEERLRRLESSYLGAEERAREHLREQTENQLRDELHESEVVEPDRQPSFEHALKTLLNRHLRENQSDTPDHILATFLINCLDAWDVGTIARDNWYGVNLEPGNKYFHEE